MYSKSIITWTCPEIARPKPNSSPSWKDFKSNSVNLGGWFPLEYNIDPSFFTPNAPSAIDKDSFCAALGKAKCGALLEKRYLEYITTKDIDNFASFGVNTLCIPVGY